MKISDDYQKVMRAEFYLKSICLVLSHMFGYVEQTLLDRS
jgi:hypothetical protein